MYPIIFISININEYTFTYTTYKAEIKNADAQESYKDGVIVLATGLLTRKEDNRRRKFIQSFFLAPQDKGYFVLNHVFRYVDESKPIEDNHVAVEVIYDMQTTPLIIDPPRTIDSPSPDLVSVHKDEAPIVEEESQEDLFWLSLGTMLRVTRGRLNQIMWRISFVYASWTLESSKLRVKTEVLERNIQ
ncbi:Ras GTPase-activating protein-binding protein 1-like protein isoform X3 [Tanacetum coccineum]